MSPTLNAAFASKAGLEDQHIDGGAGMFVPVVEQDCLGTLTTRSLTAIESRDVEEGVLFPVQFLDPFNSASSDEVAKTLAARSDMDGAGVVAIPDTAHTLRAEGFDASENGSGRGTPIVGYRIAGDGAAYEEGDATAPLTTATDPNASVVAFSIMPMNSGKDYKARETEVAQPLMAGGPVGGNQGGDFIKHNWMVRRLTPTECERLQGFPDGWTDIGDGRGGPTPDGQRYKALGNSMAINVMRWIGMRIAIADEAFAKIDAGGVRK